MLRHGDRNVLDYTAALFAAIYTAWAADLGFRTSNIWVLFVAALTATATAYAMALLAVGLRRLTDRSTRPVTRQ